MFVSHGSADRLPPPLESNEGRILISLLSLVVASALEQDTEPPAAPSGSSSRLLLLLRPDLRPPTSSWTSSGGEPSSALINEVSHYHPLEDHLLGGGDGAD